MLTSVLICSIRQFFLLCATRLRRGLIRQLRRSPCKSHTERWKGVFLGRMLVSPEISGGWGKGRSQPVKAHQAQAGSNHTNWLHPLPHPSAISGETSIRPLKFTRLSQHRAGLRSSDLRQMSRLRDPADYTSKAKHRSAGHIMSRDDDRWTRRTVEWLPRGCTRPRGRPPARWFDVFVERIKTMLCSRTADSRCRQSRLPSESPPINKLDDDRETTKRMELVLGPARSVKPGHLSI
ncbi:hypothetical protein Q1695_005291 [Nippostrongylus brasiliensis]|nr:hypothetical protein Q1695_005291 [Nippostrongylus brasiliensis]